MRAGKASQLFLPALAGLPFAAALARGGVVPAAVMAAELFVLTLLAATLLIALQGRGPRPGLGNHDIAFLALIALGLVSWFWSTYPGSTRLAVISWLSLAAFYVLCSTYLCDRRAIRNFAWWLAVAGAFFALLALLLTSGHLLGIATFARRTGYWTSFTFVNHNHFAGFVAPLALLSLGLVLAVRGAARFAAVALAFASSLAVVVSLSRGGMLSLLLGCLFLLGAFRISGSRKRSGILISALCFMILAVALLDVAPVHERLATLSDLESTSASRPILWAASIEMIADAPWFGSGLGTFKYRWPLYQVGSMKSALHAHNDYLELASELGLVGLAILLIGTFLVFQRTLPALIRSRDREIQGIGLGALAALFYLMMHSCVDFNTHIPSNAFLYVACVALALRAASTVQEKESRRWWLADDLSPRHRRLTSIVALAVIGLLALQSVLPWLAWRSAQMGDIRLWERQYEAAGAAYSRSLLLLPDQAEAAAALGDVRLATAAEGLDLGSYLKAYDRALEACPTCLDIVLAKSHALETDGSTAEAEASFRWALEIARNHPSPSLHLGLFLLRQHRWQEAQSILRRALVLANGRQETYDLVFREIERIEGIGSILDALPLGIESLVFHASYLAERQAFSLAAQQWREIIAHDNSPENIRKHLEILAQGEDRSAARLQAAQYAEAYPDDPDILILAASLLMHDGDNERTLSILASVLDKNPTNIQARVQLARLHCNNKQPEKGLELLDVGLRDSPFEVRYLMAEAVCNLRANRYERSLASAKKAVEIAPEDPGSLYTLGQIYLGLRLDQQAADTWTRCLEASPRNYACKARLEWLLTRLSPRELP